MLGIQWALVLFTAIAGIGSVCFLCVGINEFLGLAKNKKTICAACIAAFTLLVVGGLISMTHVMGHLDRVVAVFAHPAEGIFEEALLIGINCVLVALYYLFVKRDVGQGPRRIVAVLGIIVGLYFPYACGHSYMMPSQLTWNTITLPIGYLGTVLSGGAALWGLFVAWFKEEDKAIKFSGYQLIVASVACLVLCSLYAFTSGAAFNDSAVLFWGGIFCLAGIVPLICGIYVALKGGKAAVGLMALALCAALIGACCFRVLMWTGADPVMSLFGAVGAE